MFVSKTARIVAINYIVCDANLCHGLRFRLRSCKHRRLQPAKSPTGRESLGVAYDAANRQLLIFGDRDLNSYVAPDSGWTLESATSINDHGEIVGRGDYKGQDDTGFLLIPER